MNNTLRTTLLFLLPIVSLSAHAQIHIKGKVIDLDTGEPVIAAHIIKPDSTGTYSGKEGSFELKVDHLPVKLSVRHISYGESEVLLTSPLPDPLIIRIKQQISQIGEVQVSAQRLRILNEKEDFTLQDFAFDNKNLWMIGYLNNQATKGRLWLANWFGDTITSIPVRSPERLYRDVMGNVHLFLGDSVYQLFGGNDSIIKAYAFGRGEFQATMFPIKAHFNGKLVFSQLSDMGFTSDVFYYDETHPGPMNLTQVEDALGRRDFLLWLKVGGTRSRNLTVPTPMFSWNDSLYIAQVIKDSLLCYDPHGFFKRSAPFDFHKVMVLGIPEYYNFEFIPDPIGSSVYIIDHRKYKWTVVKVDPFTGKASQPIPLPDFPGMSRLTPFGNAIYFLYPEKKYPFYMRLYRYQL